MMERVKGNLLAGQLKITKIDYIIMVAKVANPKKQGTNLFF